jgi:hypothetical protein
MDRAGNRRGRKMPAVVLKVCKGVLETNHELGTIGWEQDTF